ncbi:MAG TPA: ABC transporter permease [Blastocatellia bacterium]|nr:ABC transporter permease [Blastocatellia bacterium]
MESLWLDLRYGLRMLVRNPSFTIISAGVLAIGIAASTAIFTVVNAVLLRPLPYVEPDRLLLVQESLPKLYLRTGAVSGAEYWDYKETNQVFSDIGCYTTQSFNLTGNGEATRIHAARMSPSLIPMLGVAPKIGRSFTEDEDGAGANAVVLLSERLWRTRFGSDNAIEGKSLKLDEKPYTVIGVMPAKFQFPSNDNTFSESVDLWVPMAMTDEERKGRANSFDFSVIGRLKPGVTIEQARADIESVAERMQQQYPNVYKGNIEIAAGVIGLEQEMVQPVRTVLLVLFGAVGLVLLVGCANVANLLLARSQTRMKEIAIRTAIGASSRRLIRQLLTESVLLAILGGGLGLLLASWAVDLIVRFGPDNLPRLQEVSLDTRVLLFALAVSVLTGVIFGLAPAIQCSRVDLNETLKESGGRGSGGLASKRMRGALIVFETASAIVLLIGAGLLIYSFVRLLRVPPGFNPEGAVIARTSMPAERYPKIELGKSMYKRALEQIGSLPGVEAVSVASNLPLADNWTVGFRIEGEDQSTYHSAGNTWVSNDYFRAMGIQLLSGRTFNDDDREGGLPVLVINQAMARKFWPGEDPLGKRIRWGGWGVEWLTVIGVVADVRASSLEKEPAPSSYMPIFQIPRTRRNVVFVARTSGDANSLMSSIRERLRSVDEELPVYDVRTLTSVISESVSQRRFAMLLISIFAGVALMLASVGLYAVMSNLVAQRTREIGIRIALGASRVDVLGLVLRQGALLTLIGVALGLLCSFALTRTIKSLLFGVSSTEPIVFIVIPVLLVGVALTACLVPARRATKVDPMVALRYE